MTHTASVTIEKMRPRARAAAEVLELHYRAEFMQALVSQKAGPAMKPIEGAPKPPKGTKPVIERLLDLTKEANRKQRRTLIKHMLSAPIAGRPITARERMQLESLAKDDPKTPMAERTGLIKQLGKILAPGGDLNPKDPRDILDWQHGILRDVVPGLKPLNDGRPDDAEPGEPSDDEETDPPEDTLYPGAPTIPFLNFKVQRVRCISETGEWGRDEINYSGIAVHGAVDPDSTPPLDSAERMGYVDAGQFSTGDTRDMRSRDPLHAFDLGGITTPHVFAAIFAMAEKDPQGGFGAYLQDLMTDLDAELAGFWNRILGWTLGTTALYAGVGIFMGPMLLLMTVLGFVYGLTAGIILAYSYDEIFPPTIELLQLVDDAISQPPFNGNLVSDELTLQTGDFGGIYEVDYVWELAQSSAGSPGDQDSDVPA